MLILPSNPLFQETLLSAKPFDFLKENKTNIVVDHSTGATKAVNSKDFLEYLYGGESEEADNNKKTFQIEEKTNEVEPLIVIPFEMGYVD